MKENKKITNSVNNTKTQNTEGIDKITENISEEEKYYKCCKVVDIEKCIIQDRNGEKYRINESYLKECNIEDSILLIYYSRKRGLDGIFEVDIFDAYKTDFTISEY